MLSLSVGAFSEGVASLNDMKDMLASLPQYQEQREKVLFSRSLFRSVIEPAISVLSASKYGSGVHGSFREAEIDGRSEY